MPKKLIDYVSKPGRPVDKATLDQIKKTMGKR